MAYESCANFDNMVTRIVDSYPKICKVMPCVYCVFSNDFKHNILHTNQACHASLSRPTDSWNSDNSNDLYDQVVTSFVVKEPKRDLKFFDFMKDYLYKPYSDYMSLIPVKDQYVLQITNLDKIPANVLFNIMICSRAISEWSYDIGIWNDLVEAGIHPCLAFLLCHQELNQNDKNDPLQWEISGIQDWNGHWCTDSTADFRRMISHKYASQSKMYKPAPGECTPTNVIWGNVKDQRSWPGKTVGQIQNDYKKEGVI